MKKTYVIFALFWAIVPFVQAQEGNGISSFSQQKLISLNFGLSGNLPLGELKTHNNFGVGTVLSAEIRPESRYSFILSGAFSFNQGKNKEENYAPKSIYTLPILAGARYYVVPNFFVGMQAGYGFIYYDKLKDTPQGGSSYAPQMGFNSGFGQIILQYTSMKLNVNERPLGYFTQNNLNYLSITLSRNFKIRM